MTRYDKNEIALMAKEYGFVRDTFEKVLRLKKVLGYFNEQEDLKKHLLLKGGTAINLTVFNLPRLSVDIDMDYMPNDNREEMLRDREQISSVIKDYMNLEGYQLSPASRFSHSLDAFYYQYQNAGGNRDIIKIEINYSLRVHILEPVVRRILPNAFDDCMPIQTVAPMEIFAAKGNALINRAAARDLYDWGNLITANLFENEQDLFRKCFAFYTSISARGEDVNYNFDVSAIDLLNFAKIRRDLFPVISKRDNFNLKERKEQAKEYIVNLMHLTESEREYMNRFARKEYCPELLFDDKEIVERIKQHPMALWKCKKE